MKKSKTTNIFINNKVLSTLNTLELPVDSFHNNKKLKNIYYQLPTTQKNQKSEIINILVISKKKKNLL